MKVPVEELIQIRERHLGLPGAPSTELEVTRGDDKVAAAHRRLNPVTVPKGASSPKRVQVACAGVACDGWAAGLGPTLAADREQRAESCGEESAGVSTVRHCVPFVPYSAAPLPLRRDVGLVEGVRQPPAAIERDDFS